MRLAIGILLLAAAAPAQKFYPDDPLHKEPAPLNVKEALRRKVEDYYDFFLHTFGKPGDERRIPAQAVNTLGEPMDGAWYTRRHYFDRMTPEELALGPGGRTPPADGQWTVVRAKGEGVTPGFTIIDRNKRRYFLKFDPPENLEMATAADMISARFFHALGYHVADQYLVYFDENRLVLGEDVEIADKLGKKRKMTRRDLIEILMKTRRYRDGKYRAVASLALPGRDLGPFRFFGQRKDDPNDIVPHEHRRDLRGLYAFCAWLNHEDSRAINTYDTLVEQNGTQFIRHYLLDFGSTLGSASVKPNPPRSGHEYLFAWGSSAKHLLSLGFYIPGWMLAHYPKYPSIGRIEAKYFEPEKWVPEYRNIAFENRLPDDEFWAAKQVMAFTDDDIRAIVRTGEISNPNAEEYLVRTLAERRDKVGRAFLERVLPLDRFSVDNGSLAFEDLGAKHGTAKSRVLNISWAQFDNKTGKRTSMEGAAGLRVPETCGEYCLAELSQAGDAKRIVGVYVRKNGSRHEVVGVERRW